MQFLKESTNSQNVLLGPFVASADGNTQQTGLTIANTDIKLWKEGGTTLPSASLSATHIASGVYFTTLNSTDTNTKGKLTAYVHVSPALPVWKEFMVLPANVYDSLVSASDFLQVDTHQLTGASVGSTLDVPTSSRFAATGALTTAVSAVHATATQVTDKTGYTAATVSDKTGYALTAAYDLAKTAAQASAADAILVKTDVAVSSRFAATGALTGAVSAVHATATQVTDKTGYTMAAGGIPVGAYAAGAITDAAVAADAESAIAAAVLAGQVEATGTYTLQQTMSIILSVLAGQTTASGSTFKTPNGVGTRVVATLDANNQRTAMTLTPST